MDKTDTYIKMCNWPEIQDRWRIPNGADMPDRIFTVSTVVYRRSIKKGKSHFERWDYAKENPSGLGTISNQLGLQFGRHGSSNNPEKFGSGFLSVDDTYPAKEEVVNIHQSDHISAEAWLPREWCIWLPRQDQLQEMSGMTWVYFDHRCDVITQELHEGEPIPRPTKDIAGLRVVMHELHNKAWTGEKWEAASRGA